MLYIGEGNRDSKFDIQIAYAKNSTYIITQPDHYYYRRL